MDREEATESFRRDTVDAINRCAEYLAIHAEELADQFAGGCKGWSIEFRAGDNGFFPWVEVLVGSKNADVIGAYSSKKVERF